MPYPMIGAHYILKIKHWHSKFPPFEKLPLLIYVKGDGKVVSWRNQFLTSFSRASMEYATGREGFSMYGKGQLRRSLHLGLSSGSPNATETRQ